MGHYLTSLCLSLLICKISVLPCGVLHIYLYIFIYLLEKEIATHSSILSGESCGQKSLTDYSPGGRKSQIRIVTKPYQTITTIYLFIHRASQVALVVKNPPTSAGDGRDSESIPASAKIPGGGHGIPLQYSCLENPMDRGA